MSDAVVIADGGETDGSGANGVSTGAQDDAAGGGGTLLDAALADSALQDPPSSGCEDANPCTLDLTSTTGCHHQVLSNGAHCDDGDPCSVGTTCTDGQCGGGVILTCGPTATPCMDRVCTPGVGCEVLPSIAGAACSDYDECTGPDVCNASGACTPGAPIDCPDDAQCVEYHCHSVKGCVSSSKNSKTPCTLDDDKCSGGLCSGGECLPLGSKLKCSDSDACTIDLCLSTVGCVHYPAPYVGCPGYPCDPPCDDGSSCTKDQCVVFGGCVYSPLSGQCDDGDACTGTGTCSKGACVPGALVECDDQDPCTADSCNDGVCTYTSVAGCCNPKSECGDDSDPCTTLLCSGEDGPCHFAILSNGAHCDDGDICRWGTTCTDGVCGGGAFVDCPDGSACQVSSCDPKLGCRFDPLCPDEGNPCTAESCSAGLCSRVAVSGVCAGGACLAGACRGPGDTVVVGDVLVDRQEVPSSAYDECVDAGSCPELCPGGDCVASGPAQGVDGAAAAAYCAFAGGRLCTHDEWWEAAFGHDGRFWPWGDAPPDCERVNATISGVACASSPLSPGRSAGASAFGAEDMAGNVAEWVEVPNAGVHAVGGSHASPPEALFEPWSDGVDTSTAGIRCCYDEGGP